MALTPEDRLDLLELMARYANAVDADGKEEDLFSVFTRDAVLDSPVSGSYSGVEGLKRFGRYLAEARARVVGRHHISNVRIQGDDDQATVQAYFVHSFTPREPVPPRTHRSTEILNAGRYECVARKIDGRWLLHRRTVYMDDR